ncbi:hypothetical protein JRO89_XS05G0077900 [Xanthoceras sorbifolium]|uniref:Pentatricopeptide repeat-containing protein n=1 Tax=Xanthoceras sorbifolium TaxID=99658 RepID=A0ABQ8I0W4_9ROSI|nr:hypothetical protein JRO89_XS05G0077900 [Xanthoceras sorbifolium]
MKLFSLLLRPISARHICSSSSPSTSQSAIVNEVVNILDTVSPIESALEPLVPFLSPELIPSIIQATPNPQLGFRFFIWATNHKRLLSKVSYNLVINMLLESNGFDLYWRMLEELKEAGVSVKSYAFAVLFSGYAKAGACEKALESFGLCQANAYKSGCRPDFVAYNALLNGFCKLGRVDEAFALLRSFEKDDFKLGLRGYSSLIDGLFRTRRYNEAYAQFRKMSEVNVEPDVVLYTVMIRGLSEAGKVKDAVKLMDEMNERGLVPDTYCYNAVIKGFCDAGLLNQARSLQLEILKRDSFPNTCTYTILICGMCRNGLVGEAQQIFNEMEKGANRVFDSASLKTMVEQYCESGLVLKAYKILMQLSDSGNVPDIITHNILINGFCRAGNMHGAFKLFKELKVKGLSADSVTYGTLINGLQRVGREEDAFIVFDQMAKNGCAPSMSVYKSLMTWSCRRSKVTVAFTLWLKYLRGISGREDKAMEAIEEHFEKGELEKAVRGLLEMDFNSNDFNLAPYTIWLIGLCQIGQLIHGLCKRGKLDLAIDAFLYTLKNGFKLMPRVCNYLLKSLFLSEYEKHHAYDLLSRMESLGYDLDSYLYGTTKSLLSYPWNTQEMETVSPG